MEKEAIPILWQTANQKFSLKMESRLPSIGKLRLVGIERDQNNSRTNLAEFYFDPESLLAIIRIILRKFNGKLPVIFNLIKKTGQGLRQLTIRYIPEKSLSFWFKDNVIKGDKRNPYSGEVNFTLNFNSQFKGEGIQQNEIIPQQAIDFEEFLLLPEKIRLYLSEYAKFLI
jgi:hypothetical protein